MKSITFKNLGVTINSGELVGIIGPNASGKTCFLKMICGKIKNNDINIDEHNINNYTNTHIIHHIV